MTPTTSSSVGTAYGSIYCSASKTDIAKELPKIRSIVGTPSELEISVDGAEDTQTGSNGLPDMVRTASSDGRNYVITATYAGGSNADTAGELAATLNQAYQSALYNSKEPFNGAIVYADNGTYVNRK